MYDMIYRSTTAYRVHQKFIIQVDSLPKSAQDDTEALICIAHPLAWQLTRHNRGTRGHVVSTWTAGGLTRTIARDIMTCTIVPGNQMPATGQQSDAVCRHTKPAEEKVSSQARQQTAGKT